MIDVALTYIRDEVANYLVGLLDEDIKLANAHILKDHNDVKDVVFISLVNVEHEALTKNVPHTVRIDDETKYKEPPTQLNLYVLFSFKFDDYDAALTHLSKTIERFQSKRLYDRNHETQGIPFPASLERLTFEICNLNFEQLNHLWGVLGGGYFPSILYKVRTVSIQADQELPVEEITTLVLDTRVQ